MYQVQEEHSYSRDTGETLFNSCKVQHVESAMDKNSVELYINTGKGDTHEDSCNQRNVDYRQHISPDQLYQIQQEHMYNLNPQAIKEAMTQNKENIEDNTKTTQSRNVDLDGNVNPTQLLMNGNL